MEIIRTGNGSMLLGNSHVRIPGVRMKWSSNEERASVIGDCIEIFNGICKNAGNLDLTGMIRVDAVPRIDINGKISIGSIFEFNMHSIECIAAGAAAYYAGFQDEYLRIVSRLAQKIRETFGNEIIFVAGRCHLKDYWKMYFLFALRRAGLKVHSILPHQLMRSRKAFGLPIFLWGDVRLPPGECHFKEDFVNWLYENGDKLIIFNSLQGRKMSNKTFLPEKWAPRFKMSEVLSVDRASVVLKPNGGASGNDIYFGRHYIGRDRQWIRVVEGCQAVGDYTAWKAQWLQRLNGYAFDLNLAFWVKNSVISPEDYLYTIMRVDEWDRYWRRGVINVAKGAGTLPPFI